MNVPIGAAIQFLQANSRAIMITWRRDGSLQTSPVRAPLDDAGRPMVLTRAVTAKARNLTRDPRVTLCVVRDAWFGGWMQIDGQAEVIGLPAAMPLLEDFYRRREGTEHPNWDEYRQTMAKERRVLVRVTPVRASGPV